MNKHMINNLFSGNKRLFLALLLASCLVFDACKKNNFSVDSEKTLDAPEFAQFAPADRRLTRLYPLQDNGAAFKIPVGFTNISDKDRVINFSFSSRSAVRDIDYTTTDSILIPAGKVIDSLSLQGLIGSYPIGRRDTVKVKIVGVPTVFQKDSFQLILEKYCDVILSELEAEYPNTKEFRSSGTQTYGPYTTLVEGLIATSATTATGNFVNLYDEGWNDISFQMDWTDPGNFKIIIPEQPTGKNGASDVQFVRMSANSINTFSSCLERFTITLDLLDGAKNPLTSSYRFVLSK
jgi:hypothetical protein